MELQSKRVTTRFGRSGVEIKTLRLVALTDVKKEQSNIGIINYTSLGATMRQRNFRDLTIPDPFTGGVEQISYDDLITAFPNCNLDDYTLTVECQFIPDPESMPNIDPNDLADEMRRSGYPEAVIQELLDWDKNASK